MLTRRALLQITAAASVAGVLPFRPARAQASLPQRRSLHEMDLDDPVLVALRDFVTRMKDPARNGQPLSWIGFANIHGTPAGFNLCPHGNWYFLPWHRGYVHMYEQAVRALTGSADFAMPYWDWTAHPDFPAAFGDQQFDGRPNPLFVPGRLMTTGDAIDLSVSGPAVLDGIMNQLNFEEFGSSRPAGQNSSDATWIRRPGVQGPLEANPHNNIHCDIRGPFMCAGTSPQDPIFQMHHCNIDRIWDAWIRSGRSDAASTLWRNTVFQDNYIDPTGASYSWSVSDLLAPEPLGYTYLAPEPEPEPEIAYSDPGRDLYLQYLVGAELGGDALRLPGTAQAGQIAAAPDAPASVRLDTSGLNLRAAGNSDLARSMQEAGLARPRAKLFLRIVQPDLPDGTRLRVFVNSPDATAETATDGNPNYVTSIGFFGVGPGGGMMMQGMDHGGTEGHQPVEGPSFAVDLPAAAIDETAGEITVQLVPIPQAESDKAGPVVVKSVELAVL
ncbi:tyrosinase family protein [Paracoccus spongiarum]|uniref:Tyrosinase family protein n=1 Tax=Paracoccus spongiarum TaxID=3064387 RepID=A0ABT9JGD5_9RHOB|nr:tyrosinase family protein [Paracoccus sp. 2205BS29-5]MDP5308849.1 tyrosinase family protein [Paracoccus sp. 2205BS29-5]